MAAAISIGHHPLQTQQQKKNPSHHKKKPFTRRTQYLTLLCRSRSQVVGSSDSEPSKGREKTGGEKKKGKKKVWGLVVELMSGEAEKLRESLSPKQKGDWRDLMLMSFSFAVYVYISQKLVCAYCAWISMINHS